MRYCHPKNAAQTRNKERNPSLESYRHGFKEKAKRERKPLREAKPPNLLIIALFGLASFVYIFSLFSLHVRSCVLTPSVYMQQEGKHKTSRHAKEIAKK